MLIAASVLLVSRLVTPPVTPAPVPNALGASVGGIIYVNDDDIGDPGPHNPFISNPLEDGSQYYPFDSVQEAMDRCMPGDTVQIEPGLYTESLIVRNDGCRLLGRAQGATVLQAAPQLLERAWTLTGPVDLSIEQLTLRGGSIKIEQYVWRMDGSLRLSDVTLENTSLETRSTGSKMTLELDRVTGLGGRILTIPGSDGITALHASHLNAPDTRIELAGGGTPSSGSMELQDSIVGGIVAETPDEGLAIVTLSRVKVGDEGVIADTSPGFGVSMLVEDSEIGGAGLRIIGRWRDIDISGLTTNVEVRRSRFAAAGVRLDAGIELTYAGGHVPSYHSLHVEQCRFFGEGVTMNLEGGLEDTGAIVDMRVANNVFHVPGAGVTANFGIRDSNGLPTGRIEAGLEIVNNTFSGNETGIRIDTTSHTTGLHSLNTLIKNNIIAGGRTGIEVHGLDDHTFTAENNDVLGRADRRYVGDLPDQTGRNGNISLPPWFVGANDFRLQKISPCIDRGGIGPEVPPTDIDGLARPQDGNGDNVIAPDMGAHERPGPKDRRSVTLRKL